MLTSSTNNFSGSIPASGDLYIHGAHSGGGQPLQRAAPLHITERIQVVLDKNTGFRRFLVELLVKFFRKRRSKTTKLILLDSLLQEVEATLPHLVFQKDKRKMTRRRGAKQTE
jgi:hypothetical protein